MRSAVPIIWHEYTRDQLENSPAGMRVSAKSLPPEVKTVRLVEIQGVDLNPCCGTHVPTTAALQMVKFLKAEAVRCRQSFRPFRSPEHPSRNVK